MKKPELLVRHLASQKLGQLAVLDIVRRPAADGKIETTCFFAKGTSQKEAEAAISGQILTVAQVDKAPIVTRAWDVGPDSPDSPDRVKSSEAEPDLFLDRNVAIATRNGETVENVMDWLWYHSQNFGMDGAVIFDRSPAHSDQDDWDEVRRRLTEADLPVRVVVVYSGMPLGAATLPPETHPYSVSEAPGRDRMEVPEADAWRAPLAEMSIYEIARHRFVERARAVANIDLHDLLMKLDDGDSPFDAAARSPGTSIELTGQHCYPWRVRKDHRPRHADHICIRFDKPHFRRRWCVAPQGLAAGSLLKCQRVSNAPASGQGQFYRCMAVRHPVTQSSLIVPKSSLIESEALVALAEETFQFKPVRAPVVKAPEPAVGSKPRTAIVTTMKNEGPFILEWLAFHMAIGVSDFLIYTNDCTDGTDDMFKLLQRKGLVQHRENAFQEMGLKPQHAALQMAEKEQLIHDADWIICMDVDEFLNIHVGEGKLTDLFAAVGDANMISCNWRLFGNADIHTFQDEFTIANFDRCAEEYCPKPHQAWGFKTLFKNIGIFRKIGVHRPKGLKPQIWDQISWVNGSGQSIPKKAFRNSWRSTSKTYGYDLVTLNHYAVRNAESFLVKRDRGRVNHVDRDQGMAYWFRMNNNATTDQSIQRLIPAMKTVFDELMADPEIAEMHRSCVAAHQAKIAELLGRPDQQDLFHQIVSDRMQKLSRMHASFGSKVFMQGPDVVPDDVVWGDHGADFFFSVE